MVLKPRDIVGKKANILVALIIFIFTFLIYLMTQNRSVTFWDVGEYIACSSILGVPHPPGNPFYIILGRFFCILFDFVPHAFVVNAVSGLMSALTIMFLYLVTVKFVSMFEDNKFNVLLSGIICSFFAAFSFTFWNNAIEASVYPGRDLIILFVIWLTMIWVQKSEKMSHQNLLILIIYVFFIGFCIHQTTLQVAPAILLIILYPTILQNINKSSFWIKFAVYVAITLIFYFAFITVGKHINVPDLPKIVVALTVFCILFFYFKKEIGLSAWIAALVFLILALSPHIFLIVRSALRPFINEGDPHNFTLFLDYVLRRQYGATSFMVRRAGFMYQLNHHFLRYFNWQFFHVPTISQWLSLPEHLIFTMKNSVVILLGFGGAYYQFKKNKHSFFYYLAFFIMTSLAMIIVMNLSDAEVRDRDYFFGTAYILFAFWLAVGSIAILNLCKRYKKIIYVAAFIMVISLPVINFASQYFIHDRSNEFIALDYAQNFLSSLEENAILFTNGDNDTFPLWYAQAVYDPNIEVYIHEAKEVYPDSLSLSFIQEAIDFKTDTLTGVRPDVTVANLSLLNTPWYIRHLRDREGVAFTLTEEQIDRLGPMRVDRDRRIFFRGPSSDKDFSIMLNENQIMLIKDLAIIQIVRDNYGIRPIYFAVTIPDIKPFHRNVRNEGMVERLVPEVGDDQYDLERIKKNVKEIYSYRGIFDDNVYKDENMRKLINNYGASYMRISRHYHSRMDLEKAAYYMEKAIAFVNNKAPFYYGLAQIYLQKDNLERAYHSVARAVDFDPNNYTYLLEAGLLALETDRAEKAFLFYYWKANRYLKFTDEFLEYIYAVSSNYQQYKLGIELFEKIRKYQNVNTLDMYILDLKEKLNDFMN